MREKTILVNNLLLRGICFLIFVQNATVKKKVSSMNMEVEKKNIQKITNKTPQTKDPVKVLDSLNKNENNSQLFVPSPPQPEEKKQKKTKLIITIPEVSSLTHKLEKKYQKEKRAMDWLTFCSWLYGAASILVGCCWQHEKALMMTYLSQTILKEENYDTYCSFWFLVGGTHILFPLFYKKIPFFFIMLTHAGVSLWSIKNFEISWICKIVVAAVHFGFSNSLLPHFRKYQKQNIQQLRATNLEIQAQVQNLIAIENI